jgi:hypothetical protein
MNGDKKEHPYVDWSKAPEGTTRVVAWDLKEDGTPSYNHNWEKVVDGDVYSWHSGWVIYVKEYNLASLRIKRPVNTEPTKQTFSVDVGDDENLKKALEIMVANYQGNLLVCKSPEGLVSNIFTDVDLNPYFNYCVSDLICSFNMGYSFTIVDHNEQRKKEIQEQIEKLKEELNDL